MNFINLAFNLRYRFCVSFFLFTLTTSFAQTITQEKMQKLSFMVGEWIGTSTGYDNDTISNQIPAFEKVSYKLDRNIITIDLHSEKLQLHTIIYYDEKDETYYYNPYYKNGAAKYTAELKEGKFIVWPNKNKRFIFNLTPEGNFQEYGEKFENGKWVKYFEDNFIKTP